ncbi:MAG: AI-2E family transporter [Phycisphaeraceae bacterium]
MNGDRHLWEIRWVRDLLSLTAVALILVVAYSARAVVLPVLIAFALAYIVNPVVRFTERKWKIPRLASTAVVMIVGLFVLVGAALLIVPKLIAQAGGLLSKLKVYADWAVSELSPLIEWLTSQFGRLAEDGTTAATDAATMPPAASAILDELSRVDFAAIGSFLLASLDIGIGVVGSAISLSTYLGVAAVVTAFCFVFFSWKFDAIIRWFDPFIPAGNRQQTLRIIGRMDRSVSAFVRGRVIQALVMGVILSIGWWAVGVPYWLLLGMGSGLLNLVPFAAVVGWAAATGLALVDHLSGGGGFAWMVLVWPTVVYAVAQVVDGWVVEPIVQGKATDLDPLTVLLAVLIGGSLFGLMGLILAIPLTACGKIAAQELVLPRLRDWAAGNT